MKTNRRKTLKNFNVWLFPTKDRKEVYTLWSIKEKVTYNYSFFLLKSGEKSTNGEGYFDPVRKLQSNVGYMLFETFYFCYRNILITNYENSLLFLKTIK